MKKKIGTILEEDVIRRARLLAATRGTTLSHVIEEALSRHLGASQQADASVVLSTQGMMAATTRQLEQVLDLDPYAD